ncbi:MAG TPA: anaerobic sulfatase maturase [Planctomycetes bacterium]|nr:anaerobic sulfatase maturase [Planctomycetota bacterium]
MSVDAASPGYAEAKKLLSILVKPVSWGCNLRCRYCFYNITERVYPRFHVMDAATLERMTRDLQAIGNPTVAYGWQGGEPLLAGRDFFHLAFRMQEKHRRGGQTVVNAVQTNATLIDDAWAKLFAHNRVLLGVSLDGPRKVHDHYRGAGTHEKVLNAVKLLQAQRAEFNILTVLNDRNVGMGKKLYVYLRDMGFKWLQFIPIVEPGDGGGPAPFSVTGEQYGDFLLDVFDEWHRHDVGKVSVRFFDSSVLHAGGGRGLLCIQDGSCDGYVVVEHNGDIYPCDFFVRAEWKAGNVNECPEGGNPYVRALESSVMKRFREGRKTAECEGCEYEWLCRGGCQKDRLVKSGAYGGGIERRSVLCPGYKKFYKATLGWFSKEAERLGMKAEDGGAGRSG